MQSLDTFVAPEATEISIDALLETRLHTIPVALNPFDVDCIASRETDGTLLIHSPDHEVAPMGCICKFEHQNAKSLSTVNVPVLKFQETPLFTLCFLS